MLSLWRDGRLFFLTEGFTNFLDEPCVLRIVWLEHALLLLLSAHIPDQVVLVDLVEVHLRAAPAHGHEHVALLCFGVGRGQFHHLVDRRQASHDALATPKLSKQLGLVDFLLLCKLFVKVSYAGFTSLQSV